MKKNFRYRQLKKDPNLSDDEFEELARLEEEIKLEIDDTVERPNDNTNLEPPKKQYKGIISGKIQAWRDRKKEANRTTPEMIRQLELDAKRAELEARIAKAKKVKKDNKTSKLDFHIPGKIFTDMDQKTYKSYKKSISSDDKDYSVLGFWYGSSM